MTTQRNTDTDTPLTPDQQERIVILVEKAVKTGLFVIRLAAICLFLYVMKGLFSCQPRARTEPAKPVVIYADTARVRLQHRADSSANALIIIRQKNQTIQKHYENAASAYDSIRLSLP